MNPRVGRRRRSRRLRPPRVSRLEGYLAQLKRADKLDFASWGGFAQNFAGRRIPFENAAYSTYWNRAAGESLHIPTFATGAAGPYLPATAIKGSLRTGMLFAHWRDGMLQDALARVRGERVPRRPAEMAVPGTTFEGDWSEKTFFLEPEVRRSIRWPEAFNRARMFEAVNVYAAGLLALQRQYASWAGLGLLDRSLDELEQWLGGARQRGSCLLSLGWGAGLPAKSSWLDASNPDYRQILEQFGFYNRALASNLPFPKTRRIVFLNNKPATLPGWAELSVDG